MEYYEYRGRNASGKKQNGIITGVTEDNARYILQEKGIYAQTVTEMRDFMGIRKFLYTKTSGKVKKRDKQDFLEQLAFFLDTNISLYQALITLRDKSENKAVQMIAIPMCEDIRGGLELHAAMENSGYFDKMTVYQIKAGERSGDIVATLENIVEQMEKNMDFVAKVRGAAVYPIMISTVMIVIVWFMLTYIVPQIAANLVQMGVELPAITKAVIGLSQVVKWLFPLLIIGGTTGIILYKRARKSSKQLSIAADRLKLKIPVLGNMIKKMNFRDFCRRLAVIQNSGLSLVESLNITGDTIKNVYIRDEIKDIERLVEQQGISLAAAMGIHNVFDAVMVQMISIGSDTGQTPEVLLKLSVRYEKEIENRLKVITSLMEPIMIVAIGLVVGVIMIALYLPMFSVADALK